MPTRAKSSPALQIRPLTPARWRDLETLFGERGACAGCWCMWWRLKRSEWERRKGAANKRALKRIVDAGEPPGLLAYSGGRPVGWCCVGPRDAFPSLNSSRVLKPIDDEPVWSIVCFFVAPLFRRHGVSVALVEAAVDFARRRGARIVEGYPVEPRAARTPDLFAWTGVASAFRATGFVEALRRSPKRAIMRRATDR